MKALLEIHEMELDSLQKSKGELRTALADFDVLHCDDVAVGPMLDKAGASPIFFRNLQGVVGFIV